MTLLSLFSRPSSTPKYFVKEQLKKGINYPTSLAGVLEVKLESNDLLGKQFFIIYSIYQRNVIIGYELFYFLTIYNSPKLLEGIKSKRYTTSRLRRMLVHILLGILKDDMKESLNPFVLFMVTGSILSFIELIAFI